MCIIVAKPKGVLSPKWDYIKQSCDHNSDGFAVAWWKEGMECPEIKRTLDKAEFLEYFKPLTEDKEISWLLHARIKSAGSVKLENCHCWKDKTTGLVFCHNGTLTIKPSGDMTDSETFFRHLYVPAILGGSDGDAVVEAVIGGSKFAFMKPNGEIITYGTYVADPECPGVMFSNSTYKPYRRTTTYTTSSYSNYNSDCEYPDIHNNDAYYPNGNFTTRTKASASKTGNLLMACHGWAFFRPNK